MSISLKSRVLCRCCVREVNEESHSGMFQIYLLAWTNASLLVFQWFCTETSAISSKICVGFNRPLTVTPTLQCVVSFIYTHNKAHNIPKMKKKKKKVLAPHPHTHTHTHIFWIWSSRRWFTHRKLPGFMVATFTVYWWCFMGVWLQHHKVQAHCSAYYARTISDSNGGPSWQKTQAFHDIQVLKRLNL